MFSNLPRLKCTTDWPRTFKKTGILFCRTNSGNLTKNPNEGDNVTSSYQYVIISIIHWYGNIHNGIYYAHSRTHAWFTHARTPDVRTRVRLHAHSGTRTYTHTHAHMHSHIHAHSCTGTYTHTHVLAHTRTFRHSHIHAHSGTRT